MKVVPWGNVWLPMLPMPTVTVAGLRGSGKTLFLRLMMQAILARRDVRSFVYDPKRELFEYLPAMAPGRKIYILDPTDRDSAAWDIAADFPDYDDALALADLFMRRREKATEAGKWFEKAEKTVMTGIIRGLQQKAPGRWTLRDVILAALDDSIARELVKDQHFANVALNRLKSGTEAGENVWLSFTISLADFESLAALWYNAKTSFSIERDWMKSPSICLLGVSQKDPETYAPFNRTFFRRIKECLLGQPERPDIRTCVVLDELPTLGNVADEVGELLRVGRSKRIGLLNAFQDVNTLYEKFTEQGAKSLLSNFSEVAIFRCQMETAKWAAELIGESRWRRWTESYDPSPPSRFEPGLNSPPKSTYQEHFERHFLVSPTAFSDLPKPSKAAKVGLHGYLLSSYYGRMKLSMSSENLSQRLVMPLPGTRDTFIPRPKSDFVLTPWTDAEMTRLGLHRAELTPNLNARPVTSKRSRRRRKPKRPVDLRDFY